MINFMNTDWKLEIIALIEDKKWQKLIDILQSNVTSSGNSLDVILNLDYVLIHILVEEDYNDYEEKVFTDLLRNTFTESYSKYSENDDYLFFTGITCHISEWYFDIDISQAKTMIEKAYKNNPDSMLFEWGYYAYVQNEKSEKVIQCSRDIIKDSYAMTFLKDKSILGEYIMDIIKYWTR